MAKSKQISGVQTVKSERKSRKKDLALRLWSLRELEAEFGMARDTIAKRIAIAGLKADGEEATHAVYRLRSVVPVLFELGRSDTPSANDQLARARADTERSNALLKELELGRQQGRYVLADDARTAMAGMAKKVTQMLDTLPDVLERDAQISAKAVVKCQEIIAGERDRLAKELGA